MSKLFLSYSRQDGAFAKDLSQTLKSLGHDAWIDEENVLWGDLIGQTQEALAAASAVVVILSESSKNSQWVAFELGAATALGKRLFPIVLSSNPDVVPIQLQGVVYLRADAMPVTMLAQQIHEALQKDV
jgi:TIR domain